MRVMLLLAHMLPPPMLALVLLKISEPHGWYWISFVALTVAIALPVWVWSASCAQLFGIFDTKRAV